MVQDIGNGNTLRSLLLITTSAFNKSGRRCCQKRVQGQALWYRIRPDGQMILWRKLNIAVNTNFTTIIRINVVDSLSGKSNGRLNKLWRLGLKLHEIICITVWSKHSDRVSWQGRRLRVTVIGSTTFNLTLQHGPEFPCFKGAAKSKTCCLLIWNSKQKLQTITYHNESLTEASESVQRTAHAGLHCGRKKSGTRHFL